MLAGLLARFPTQRLHQQPGIVRDDAVHTHLSGAEHLSRIIDRPGNHGLARSMNFFYQPGGKQPVMRHNIGGWKLAPTAKLPARLCQRAQDESAVNRMQLTHDTGQKRRDEISALRTHAIYGTRHQLLHAAHLHFDIQKRSARIAVQDIFQTQRPFFSGGTAGLKLLECVLAYYQPVQPWIMANNGLPVAGAANVKFKAVRSMFQGQIKRGKGIFRSVLAGAAMSEQ
jgi:hypothetical protein